MTLPHSNDQATDSGRSVVRRMIHDLRNPLTGILGYLQLLDMKLHSGEDGPRALLRKSMLAARELETRLRQASDYLSLEHGDILGQAARVLIVLVAAVVALDQIGIESTLLILVLSIVLGAVIGGAALAFGMGARDAVRGFIAANDLHQNYRVGDQIRIGEIQGKIIRFSRTAVVLETAEGRARIPAGEFEAQPSFLVEGGAS